MLQLLWTLILVLPFPASADYRIQVLDAQGRPVRGASAFLVHRQDLLDVGVTGADGRVGLRANPQHGLDLWVAGVAWEPVRVRLRPASGDVEVMLPDGEVISGRATVDGSPPDETMWLEMEPGLGLEVLPAAVKEYVTSHSMDTLFQPLGKDGGFLFIVPVGWTGILTPTPPHAQLLRRRGEVVSYREVAAGDVVQLDYASVPVIEGTTVLTGTDIPLAGVKVHCVIEVKHQLLGGDVLEISRSATTDMGGRFRIPATVTRIQSGPGGHQIRDIGQEAAPLMAEVVLVGMAEQLPIGFGRRSENVNISDGVHVGLVAMDFPHRLMLRVRDMAGVPVGGAVARVRGHRQWESRPTNEAGITFVESFFDYVGTVIFAPGFEPVAVELAVGMSIETVALQRATTLEVRTLPGAVVRIESEGRGLVRSDGLVEFEDQLIGALVASRRRESEGAIMTAYDVRATTEGEILVTGVVPGAVHQVQLVDPSGVAGEVQRVVLQAGEHVRIDLSATQEDELPNADR